jgi:small GTP-binding protein
MPGIFDTVVDANVQALLRREQRLLVELRETLDREQADERRRVDELLATLEDLFTIVIVGEFNAGKSSLINALFGAQLRVEGPIPVDDVVSVLRYGEQASSRKIRDYVIEQFYPVEFLRNITLVDTPGTNSIVQRHQEITEDYIPRADLVLFVTSIDRPLSESERRFLEYIREWGKKVVFVLNKIDTKSEAEVAQVVDYLKTNVRAIFGFHAVIYPVAGKLALESKLGSAPPREWTRSRFEALEDYIFQVLSEKERIRIKLTAPLDTILGLARRQFRMIESRREVLAADKARIESIEAQLEKARADLEGNFRQFVLRIDNLLMDMERRGLDFLDNYVRIQHVMLLRDALRFREEFERQVFQGWKVSIDSTIQEAVDWLVKENMKLWNTTVEQFQRRAEQDARNEEIIGRVGREFAYNREEVYARMRTNAEQRLASYDVNVESRRIIDHAMRAVLHSFGLGAGALGLGYLVSAAVSSTAVDVTGLTAATMLLVTSFLILPYKRTKAKEEFRRRIEELRGQLSEALKDRKSVG